MALDAKGQAVFFTRGGKMLGSVPPPVRELKLTPNLPPAPPLRPGQMYNGAARLADGAVPWEIEAAAREAVEEALESPLTVPRQNQGREHVAMGQATESGQTTEMEQAAETEQTQPKEVNNGTRTRAA